MATKQARAEATKLALVEAAVELTCRHGINGWDLRGVGRLAGQGNNSVVQYHFGTKELLVGVCIDRELEVCRAGAADLTSVDLPGFRRAVWFVVQILSSADWRDSIGQGFTEDEREFLTSYLIHGYGPASEVLAS